MVILSVDYGDVRTGIAVCDKDEMLAVPFEVINEASAKKLARKICDTASLKSAEMIVVGLPRNMDGTLGFRAKKCEKLAGMLSDMSGIETVLWDERCTTMSANIYFNDANVRGKKRKTAVDKAAATIILQDYLDFRKNEKNCSYGE